MYVGSTHDKVLGRLVDGGPVVFGLVLELLGELFLSLGLGATGLRRVLTWLTNSAPASVAVILAAREDDLNHGVL